MNTLRLFTRRLPLIHTSVRHYYRNPKRGSSNNSQALFVAAGVVTGLVGCSVYFLGKRVLLLLLLLLLLLFFCFCLGRPDEETEYLGKFEQQKYTNCESILTDTIFVVIWYTFLFRHSVAGLPVSS